MKIYGPPGTGKTTTLQQIIEYAQGEITSFPLKDLEKELITKVDTNDIAFVSFTNTAIDVLAERTGIPARTKKAQYFRTFHGLALSVLKDHFDKDAVRNLKYLKNAQATFAAKMGYYYSKDPFSFAEGNRMFHKITYVIERYLPILQNVENTLRMLEDPKEIKFALKWFEFKKEKRLMDYDDILITAFEHVDEFYVPVKIAIIDEAQDLGLLEFYLLEHAFSDSGYVILAGDPLQSIYSFKGADPRLFARWKADKIFTLQKSYRLPLKIWLLAQSFALTISKKLVTNYRPANLDRIGDVKILNFEDAIRYAVEKAKSGDKVLILSRTNSIVQTVAMELALKYSIAYSHLKRHSYFESYLLGLIKAVNILKNLDTITRTLFSNSLFLSETDWINALIKRAKNKHTRYVLTEFKEKQKMNLEVLQVLQKIRTNFENEIYLTEFDKKVLAAHFLNKKVVDLTKKLFVDTIHAAKGEEADVVIFVNAISKRKDKYLNMNDIYEKLVQYVALTRARKELVFAEDVKLSYKQTTNYVDTGELLNLLRTYKNEVITMLA